MSFATNYCEEGGGGCNGARSSPSQLSICYSSTPRNFLPLLTPAAPSSLPRFLDFTCPFCKKIFGTIHQNADAYGRLRTAFRFHQIVQPWHFQNTMLHEAACAVRTVHPEADSDAQVSAWAVLFANQVDFTDVNVEYETRAEIHARLSVLLEGYVPRDRYLSLVEFDKNKIAQGAKNPGCAVTQQMKDICKYARTVGVHVSPTVYLGGEEQKEVSSGWTMERWEAFVGAKGASVA